MQTVPPIVPAATIEGKASSIVNFLCCYRGLADSVIAKHIKEYLQDSTLANPESIAVKTALINHLSLLTVDLRKQERTLVTDYLDGTQQRKGVDDTIIQAKPESPWHKLTFEGFLIEYLNKIRSHKDSYL